MKKSMFVVLLGLILGGCASNPTQNSQFLAQSNLFDPLFVVSVSEQKHRVDLKSIAEMFQGEKPGITFLPMDYFVVSTAGVHYSRWDKTKGGFVHKLRLSYSEIKSATNTAGSGTSSKLKPARLVIITSKSNDKYKFYLSDKFALEAKRLINSRI